MDKPDHDERCKAIAAALLHRFSPSQHPYQHPGHDHCRVDIEPDASFDRGAYLDGRLPKQC